MKEKDEEFKKSVKRIFGHKGGPIPLCDTQEYKDNDELPPRNEAEAECFQRLKSQGWFVTKRGAPDFFCFKKGQIIAVEVKKRKTHKLKRMQYKVLMGLSKRGVKSYRWSPDGGFVPVSNAMPREEEIDPK